MWSNGGGMHACDTKNMHSSRLPPPTTSTSRSRPLITDLQRQPLEQHQRLLLPLAGKLSQGGDARLHAAGGGVQLAACNTEQRKQRGGWHDTSDSERQQGAPLRIPRSRAAGHLIDQGRLGGRPAHSVRCVCAMPAALAAVHACHPPPLTSTIQHSQSRNLVSHVGRVPEAAQQRLGDGGLAQGGQVCLQANDGAAWTTWHLRRQPAMLTTMHQRRSPQGGSDTPAQAAGGAAGGARRQPALRSRQTAVCCLAAGASSRQASGDTATAAAGAAATHQRFVLQRALGTGGGSELVRLAGSCTGDGRRWVDFTISCSHWVLLSADDVAGLCAQRALCDARASACRQLCPNGTCPAASLPVGKRRHPAPQLPTGSLQLAACFLHVAAVPCNPAYPSRSPSQLLPTRAAAAAPARESQTRAPAGTQGAGGAGGG